MLIQGAYASAPKFKSYRVNPSSNRSYNKSSSNNTNKNYIIVLNQSEKSYASENNSNITNETKKSDNSDKKDYKYVKTYTVKTREQIQREYKERLEARQKKVNIIYEFNYQSLNNQDVTRFFIVHNENAYRYWRRGVPVSGVVDGYLVNKSDFSEESIKARVNLFIKSINEYSDFGGKVLEYPIIKQLKEFQGRSGRYDYKTIKNENKAKALALEDEDLLYRYNKLNDEYEQFTYWYNGEFRVLHKKRNKVKKLQPKLNEVIAEINSKYARENKQYLVIEYDSGYIGEYRIPSKYIKIKNENGRVLYEAIYKNYSMIELVEEFFVN
jgi:hypothetical protein